MGDSKYERILRRCARQQAWLMELTRVLLTGASTGLGLATARQLLDLGGYHLVLTARESSLPRFAAAGLFEGPSLWLRRLDVTSAEQRVDVVAEMDRDLGGCDVLINNAGVAYRSVVEHVSQDERLRQMAINFLAPMELARLVLPGMRARCRGRILNISSVGGMMAMPTMAVYSASKFALEGASEALWYEVRPWGIHVSLIEPGFIRSSSFENTLYTEASRSEAADPQAAYHAHYTSMAPFIAKLMQASTASSDDVARVVVRTVRRRHPPLRVVATVDARLFAILRRILPRRVYHELLYRMLPGIRRWGPRSE